MPFSTTVHEIRLGPIRASVWQEMSSDGLRHTVTVARVEADDDHFRLSSRFERDDLPLVAEVMDLAHLWIFEQAELIA